MRARHLAAYMFLAIVWGCSFIVVLKVVQAFGWVGAVTFRSLVAGTVLLALAIATRRRLRFRGGALLFVVVGATTVAGQLLGLSYAAPRIGTAMAAILVAPIPLFSMIISQLWGLEQMTRKGLAGLILGFVGILLLVGFPAVAVTPQFFLGCAASLFGSLCAAIGSTYASHRLRGVGSWEVTIGSFLAGGLISLPLLFAVPVPSLPGAIDFAYLLVLGGLMSAATYVIYFRLVGAIGATKTISVEFAVTIVAVFVGAVVLHEPLGLVQYAGAAIIIAGCALVLGLTAVFRRQG